MMGCQALDLVLTSSRFTLSPCVVRTALFPSQAYNIHDHARTSVNASDILSREWRQGFHACSELSVNVIPSGLVTPRLSRPHVIKSPMAPRVRLRVRERGMATVKHGVQAGITCALNAERLFVNASLDVV